MYNNFGPDTANEETLHCVNHFLFRTLFRTYHRWKIFNLKSHRAAKTYGNLF